MRRLKEWIERWIKKKNLTASEKRLIGVIGVLSILLLLVVQIVDNMPLEGYLLRNTYGAGDRQEQVLVEWNEGEQLDIEIIVSEQAYTTEEIREIFETGTQWLDAIVLGENETFDKVVYDLNLVDEIEGTAVEVSWHWTPYEAIGSDGAIQQNYVAEDGTLVQLSATLSYGDEEVEYTQTIHVFPKELEGKEAVIAQIIDLIEQENQESLEYEMLELPQASDIGTLTWYPKKSYRGFVIFGMGMVLILLVFLRKEQEQKESLAKRCEEMQRDYAQIVSTFTLYIGAGMTVKNAWKRIVEGYISEVANRETHHAYEEMKRAYYEMANGILERDCYEQFGKRCNLRCYQRFALLLSQNVRKGTKGLSLVLEQEVREALEEKKNRIKQDAERAGTKLLMPMFLMLSVVLVIIVVPAFLSIQI
ncbi:MAG: type II secretion system F family protein [Eubacteriales bacterium]